MSVTFYLIIYMTMYLDQETAPHFESSCRLFLPVEPLKGRDNPVNCFAQRHKANLPAYLHTITLMLIVKQGSCEY